MRASGFRFEWPLVLFYAAYAGFGLLCVGGGGWCVILLLVGVEAYFLWHIGMYSLLDSFCGKRVSFTSLVACGSVYCSSRTQQSVHLAGTFFIVI